ncbi:GlyGly-CTERM sorting domain-containing protein [Vibrio casei]|uniref:GlyGly-CTERM sorting domain-containing protein n=1 Tax=Vibrio casei TaxID=673372 RepID=UPI000B5CD75A|nr:GlyGly-CTERM sorting domain-containing protein [Vibrio casei]
MNKAINAISILACLLGSTQAMAIENGDQINPSQYSDYLVQLETANGNCTGTLFTGQFILTDAQCVLDYDGTGEVIDNAIKVSKGTQNASESYSRTFTLAFNGNTISNKELYLNRSLFEYYGDIEPVYKDAIGDFGLLSPTAPLDAELDNNFYMKGGVVVLKLNESIPTKTGVLIDRNYDAENNASNLKVGSETQLLAFGDNNSLEAMPITINFDASIMYQVPEYRFCTEINDFCEWNNSDTFEFLPLNASQKFEKSDVGAPLVFDGVVYGLVHSYDDFEGTQMLAARADFVMEELAASINEIAYPNRAGVNFASGSTETLSFTVPVQNFTSEDFEMVSPYLNDTTGLFTADFVGCDQVLTPLQGCYVQVSFNAGGETQPQTAELVLNNDVSVKLFADIETETADNTDNTGTTESNSGGASGGSTGLGMLLGLIGLGIFRKKQSRA